MADRDLPTVSSRILTPAGGIVLSVAVSGLLWSGMAIALHLAGRL